MLATGEERERQPCLKQIIQGLKIFEVRVEAR
jgi:hypothetical protein